jgi:starch phosphorylase
MKPSRAFSVAPHIPKPLDRLLEIGYNLRWCWDYDSIDLFRRLGAELWEQSGHNPIRLLTMVPQETLNALAEDEGFKAHLDTVYQKLDTYMTAPGWAQSQVEITSQPWVAYFCAEFGLTECLPIYAGGLGILAGDYLKAASDLGLPAVGVGLLYWEGYLNQYLNPDGWQQEEYVESDFYNAPLRLVREVSVGTKSPAQPDPAGAAAGLPTTDDQRKGQPLTIEIPFRTPARAQIWRAQVGRTPLLLLDTNLYQNSEAAQRISSRLYGEGDDLRIQQEIALGIGGLRALVALGMTPALCHLNEGHAAFVTLERIRLIMEHCKLSFAEAHLLASASSIFTTHTPVPAGVDRFSRELVDRHLGPYITKIGATLDDVMALGNETGGQGQPLTTTVLAMRSSAYTFGVSQLHGRVSRRIWGQVWPNVPEDDVPIGAVTNGVHVPSWASREMAALFDRYLGPRWLSRPASVEDWRQIDSIPDDELWAAHQRRRQRLVAFARTRLREQLARRGAPANEIEATSEILDANALTIAFARRFATYKRATLLFRDLTRLKSILSRPGEPVQIIYAGKAHPTDHMAKDFIKQLVHHIRDDELRPRIVFLENHDIELNRYLAQGADVWLNTPRRPMEASGTSGMKAAANGVLHVSILDGWWDEAYQPGAGWAIGRGEEYGDEGYQDGIESQDTYDLLEREVIPMFYDRDHMGLPRRWIAAMKKAMRAICPVFNANRMLKQYVEEFYEPAARRALALEERDCARARALAQWIERVRRAWSGLAIRNIETDDLSNLQVGDKFQVRVLVELGQLTPDEIMVALYVGKLDHQSEMLETEAVALAPQERADTTQRWFAASVECRASGRAGFAVRILPHHPDLHDPYCLNLVLWS